MKRIFFSALLLGGIIQGHAQNMGNYVPNYVPPSPDASALGKYVDHPVSTFTGVTSVKIPLFEIKCGRITVPIDLSYHGSGVKVDEIASRVGIGWSLNAGGAIIRTVKGIADDAGGPYSYPNGSLVDHGQGYFYRDASNLSLEYAVDQGNSIPIINDLEPDDYFYKFGKYSGRIYFSNPSTAYTLNKDQFKIDGPFGGNSRFVITNDDGLKYTFSAVEAFSYSPWGGGATTYYPSTWYLTKIEDPVTNKKVEFSYRTDMPAWFSYSTIMFEGSGLGCGDNAPGTVDNYINTPMILQKITYDEGFIEFKTDYNRSDLVQKNATGILAHDKAYTEINQYIYTNNSQALKKGYNFSYYTTSNGSNPEDKRLYLDAVEEKGADGSFLPPYAFFYKNRDLLPSRQSAQQDIWGYYNGNGASARGAIKIFQHNYNDGSGRDYLPFDEINNPSTNVVPGVDRSSNSAVADYGALIKVVYPTKGYTLYNYELNTFDNYIGGGLRIKSIGDYSYNDQLLLLKTYTYNGGFLGGPLPQVGIPGSSGPIQFWVNRTVLGANDGNYVGYASVEVRENSPTNSSLFNGTRIYNYSTDRDIPGTFTNHGNSCSNLSDLSAVQAKTLFPFFEWESRESRRGLLLSEITLDSQNNFIKKITNSYTLHTTNLATINSSFTQYNSFPQMFALLVDLRGTRNLNRDVELLTSTDEGLYRGKSDDRSVTEIKANITDYTYTEALYDGLYKRSETHYSSNGGYTSISYKYPFDYASTASAGTMGQMVNMNYISPIISKMVSIVNPNIIGSPGFYSSAELTSYKTNSNSFTPSTSIVPAQIFSLNTKVPISQVSSNLFPPDPANPGNLYEKRAEFISYDLFSNPTLVMQDQKYQLLGWSLYGDHLTSKKQVASSSVQTFDLPPQSWNEVTDADAKTGTTDYVWSGYNTAFPITLDGQSNTNVSFWAKGGTFSLSAVPAGRADEIDINQTAPSTWKYYSFNLATISQEWGNSLVYLTGTAKLDDVSITTGGSVSSTHYYYDALQRLQSVMDPNGNVKKYDYDNFSRLINIRDQNNNIVSHTDYHYKYQ